MNASTGNNKTWKKFESNKTIIKHWKKTKKTKKPKKTKKEAENRGELIL